MIKKFEYSKLNEMMQIWLETNIDAHSFISKDYWNSHYEMVKSVLPTAEVFMYEEDVVKGFIGIIDEYYIAVLFIAKQFQDCGIGAQLVNECKKRFQLLELDVYVKNTKAIAFYEKHGFIINHEKMNIDTNEKEYNMSWNL